MPGKLSLHLFEIIRQHSILLNKCVSYMRILKDIYNRDVRLTQEREEHFIVDHPEMRAPA